MVHDRAYKRFKTKQKQQYRIKRIKCLFSQSGIDYLESNVRKQGSFKKQNAWCQCPNCRDRANHRRLKRDKQSKILYGQALKND